MGNEAKKERGDAVGWGVVWAQWTWDDAFGDEFIVRGRDVPGNTHPKSPEKRNHARVGLRESD